MVMPPINQSAAMLIIAASFFLGIALPVLMALATKSSPLVLGCAALCAISAFGMQYGRSAVIGKVLAPSKWSGIRILAAGLLYMAISVLWAHDRVSSADQFLQFILPVAFTLVLLAFFVPVAPFNRTLLWIIAAGLTAALMAYDLKTGMKLRELTGGRHYNYSYNRSIVTLVVLLWPLLALSAARRQWYLGLMLLPIFVITAAGESETAILGAIIGVIVLPLAWVAPQLVRKAGLIVTLLLITVTPFFGTLAKKILGATVHNVLANAHSDDRVNIWLSFEAAAQQKWLLGNGFGSSLNLQNAPVAKLVPPELVMLLGASHPHNAFLQLWVELGLVGALLFAALTVVLFSAVSRMVPRLQPFALTCIAVVAGIALVSHGAWQAWWIAAIGAAIVSFAVLDRELRSPE